MKNGVIRVEGLGKQYQIGAKRARDSTLRESLTAAFTGPFRWLMTSGNRLDNNERVETIWALKDVSFEVKEGEVLGVIGRNGAGKSTLLKILSRITEPTEGHAEIRGRVGSLLEVGTGFHSELTGRENIYLNGAILGMKKEEIGRKFDEIVAFAEVDKFIDTPVKHYSSGMYMRLAFAVAAYLEPEILLVDEVLAVGDAAFQKKCLGKMGNVAKQGRTILFVSHNMTAVQSLCQRCLLLTEGILEASGDPREVVSRYLNGNVGSNHVEQVWDDPESAPGNESIALHRVSIVPLERAPRNEISVLTPIAIELEYWNLQKDVRLNVSLSVFNQEGTCIFVTTTLHEQAWHGRAFPRGLFRSVCRIPGNLLNDGQYTVSVLFVKDEGVVICKRDDLARFEVRDAVEARGHWFGKWTGTVRPRLEWTTECIGSL